MKQVSALTSTLELVKTLVARLPRSDRAALRIWLEARYDRRGEDLGRREPDRLPEHEAEGETYPAVYSTVTPVGRVTQ